MTALLFNLYLFLLGCGSQPLAHASNINLESSYQAALKQSETMATQIELINQAEERYNQAKASLLPNISGIGTYLVQQAPPAGSATTFSPTEQTTLKITGTQPIFHGMKEYAGILQQNLQVTAQMSAKQQAAASLYADLAANFYSILSLEQDLTNLEQEVSIDKKRIKDLNVRVNLGRSKSSEVLAIQSVVDSLEAQIEQIRGQLLVTRDAFSFLTGLAKDSQLSETDTFINKQSTPVGCCSMELNLSTIDSYLKRIEERPDVKAARDTLASVEKTMSIARAGHFPQVDLTGDYFFKRPGISQYQHWDVILTGTLPLFAGGMVNSQIRQAASQARVSELTLSKIRRQAEQDIRATYDSCAADLGQIRSLTKAAESAKNSYKAQVHDYQLGRVTNLDVLQATSAAQQAQRALDHARFQAKLDFLKLDIATARRPN